MLALPGSPPGSPPGSSREPLLDGLRGLALLVIFWDHLLLLTRAKAWPLYLTPSFLGYWDFAEVFVFLSGLVFAMAYGRSIKSLGGWALMARAARRSGEVYAANLLIFLIVFGISLPGALFFGMVQPELAALFRDPLASLLGVLPLYFLPLGFDILPLYVLLLPFMALALWGLLSRRTVVLALSLGVWASPWLWPTLNLPRDPRILGSDGAWFFNPLSWQLVFVLGMVCAAFRHRLGRLPLKILTPLAWLVLVLGLVGRLWGGSVALELLQVSNPDAVWIDGILAGLPALGEKTRFGPLRLVSFAAAVLLVWRYRVVLERHLCAGRMGLTLGRLGRRSLLIFGLGIVLNYALAGGVLFLGGGDGLIATVGLLGLALLAWASTLGQAADPANGTPAHPLQVTHADEGLG